MTATPPIVDREAWQRARDELLVREKAHTHEGDAIAAARRRLPMTPVEPVTLTGPDGPVSLLDAFEGRDLLITYQHMWFDGEPVEGQCPGCTISMWDLPDPLYVNERGVTLAILCEGPWEQVAPFREFMGYTTPWYSMHGTGLTFPLGGFACLLRRDDAVYLTYETGGRGTEGLDTLHLLDLTVYGRRETWEDSPAGWPDPGPAGEWWSRGGRPLAQWTRPGVASEGAS